MCGRERMVTLLVSGWWEEIKGRAVTQQDLLSTQREVWTIPYRIIPGMRENMQTIKLVAGGKVANEHNISMFIVFPLPRWTEKHFCLVPTINLLPQIIMFNLCDYAYNITLSLAIQRKGFFGEWFPHGNSSLVCILHRNHCTFICWDPADFLFTLVLVLILLFEHHDAIWGLRSLLREGVGLLRAGPGHGGLPVPRARDGGAQTYRQRISSTQWNRAGVPQ